MGRSLRRLIIPGRLFDVEGVDSIAKGRGAERLYTTPSPGGCSATLATARALKERFFFLVAKRDIAALGLYGTFMRV